MRDAAALALLMAATAVPRTTGFSIATVPAAPRLRARVCGRGALAVQAVLDKMGKAAIGAVGKAAANAPLPTSPRPQEILDAATTGEVADSLDRFVKSAPEGFLRSGKLLSEKVLPVAADLLFNAKAGAEASEDAAPEEPLPAGWTAHLDNKSGMTYYFEEATATAVWTRPSESPRQPASEGATAGSTEQQLLGGERRARLIRGSAGPAASDAGVCCRRLRI